MQITQVINHSYRFLYQGSRGSCLLVTLIGRHARRYICLYRFGFCWYSVVNYKRDVNVPSAKTVSLRTRLGVAQTPCLSLAWLLARACYFQSIAPSWLWKSVTQLMCNDDKGNWNENKGKDRPAQTPRVVPVVASHYRLQIMYFLSQACLKGIFPFCKRWSEVL